jgi:hypothetical protein
MAHLKELTLLTNAVAKDLCETLQLLTEALLRKNGGIQVHDL